MLERSADCGSGIDLVIRWLSGPSSATWDFRHGRAEVLLVDTRDESVLHVRADPLAERLVEGRVALLRGPRPVVGGEGAVREDERLQRVRVRRLEVAENRDLHHACLRTPRR